MLKKVENGEEYRDFLYEMGVIPHRDPEFARHKEIKRDHGWPKEYPCHVGISWKSRFGGPFKKSV